MQSHITSKHSYHYVPTWVLYLDSVSNGNIILCCICRVPCTAHSHVWSVYKCVVEHKSLAPLNQKLDRFGKRAVIVTLPAGLPNRKQCFQTTSRSADHRTDRDMGCNMAQMYWVHYPITHSKPHTTFNKYFPKMLLFG